MTDEELVEVGRGALRLSELGQAVWYDDDGAIWEGADIALWCFDGDEYVIEVHCGLSSCLKFGPCATPTEAINAAIEGQKQRAEDWKKIVVTDQDLIAAGSAVLSLPRIAELPWYADNGSEYENVEAQLYCLGDGKYNLHVSSEGFTIVHFGPYATPQECVNAALEAHKRVTNEWAKELREARRHGD